MIEALVILLCGLILAGLVYHLAALFCVWEFFRPRPAALIPPALDPVSVLKPLKGIDPGFMDNLRSFLTQDHPDFEVLLGFSEQDRAAADEAGRMVELLQDRRVRVVTSNVCLGPNRKVSNLQGLVDAAAHQLLVLSDSDMRVEPHYLRTISCEYAAQHAGMVTNLYKISSPGTIGAALESLTISLDVIPSVLVARRLEGVTFGLGASIMLSKRTLDEIGGLRLIADYLADDYQLGNRVWKKGHGVVLSQVVLETVPGAMTFRDHIMHQVRWARTYRASRPWGFAGYGITHILPLSLALLLVRGADALCLSLLGAVLLVRFAEAVLMQDRVIRSPNWFVWLPLLPFKDITSFSLWAWSFIGNSVTWRGRTFRVLRDGRIREKKNVRQ